MDAGKVNQSGYLELPNKFHYAKFGDTVMLKKNINEASGL